MTATRGRPDVRYESARLTTWTTCYDLPFIEFAEGTLGTLETRRSVNFVVYEVAN
jgi:hypothetical protein